MNRSRRRGFRLSLVGAAVAWLVAASSSAGVGIAVDKSVYRPGDEIVVTISMDTGDLPAMPMDAYIAVLLPGETEEAYILDAAYSFYPFDVTDLELFRFELTADLASGDYTWFFVLTEAGDPGAWVDSGTAVMPFENAPAGDDDDASGDDDDDDGDVSGDDDDDGAPGDGGTTAEQPGTGDDDDDGMSGNGGDTAGDTGTTTSDETSDTADDAEIVTGGVLEAGLEEGDAVFVWPDLGYGYSRVAVTQGGERVETVLGGTTSWTVTSEEAKRFASFTAGEGATVTVDFAEGTDPATGAGSLDTAAYTAVHIDSAVPDTFSVGGVRTVTGSVDSGVDEVRAMVWDLESNLRYAFTDTPESGRFAVEIRFPEGAEGSYWFGLLTDQVTSTTTLPISVVAAPPLTWHTTDLRAAVTPVAKRASSMRRSDILVNGFRDAVDPGTRLTLTGSASLALQNRLPVEQADGSVAIHSLVSGLDGTQDVAAGTGFEVSVDFPSAGVYKVEINMSNGQAAFNKPVYVGAVLPLIEYEAWYLRSHGADTTPAGSLSLEAARAEWLRLVNLDRASAGLGAVELESTLNGVAQGHAEDMAANNFFSHGNLAGQSPQGRAEAGGWTASVGENIAKSDSVAEMQVGLLESAGHRYNILNDDWSVVGLGVAWDGTTGIGVQNFSARPGDLPVAVDAFDGVLLEEPIPSAIRVGETVSVRGTLTGSASSVILFVNDDTGTIVYEPLTLSGDTFQGSFSFDAVPTGTASLGISLDGASSNVAPLVVTAGSAG